MTKAKGWHSRGYLPHFDSPEIVQFITFRLADSLPRSVVDYFDRYMRDDDHLARTVEYVEQNPVKAGLVASKEAWPWSSAQFRKDS